MLLPPSTIIFSLGTNVLHAHHSVRETKVNGGESLYHLPIIDFIIIIFYRLIAWNDSQFKQNEMLERIVVVK